MWASRTTYSYHAHTIIAGMSMLCCCCCCLCCTAAACLQGEEGLRLTVDFLQVFVRLLVLDGVGLAKVDMVRSSSRCERHVLCVC
jgi:hypothetical protein